MLQDADATLCTDADALVHTTWSTRCFMQFVNALYQQRIHSLLHDLQHLVVDRIEVGAVRWLQIR